MLSTRPDVRFTWGYETGVVKLVQNCDTKTIYSNNMDGTPHEAKAAASPKIGTYTWEIVVNDLTITFKDNVGAPVVVPNHLGKEPVYVYVGASNDNKKDKSRWYKLMVMSPPKAKSLGADVIMGDDFSFLNDTRPREWDRVPTDGSSSGTEVDYGCGGMNGNPSYRFQGSERSATSKEMDFHRGGIIETCVRYGSKEAAEGADGAHTCSPMNDRDGMTLQASTDGTTFSNVLRLVSGQFPELKSENFTCMRTVISTKAYPQFMSSTLSLRWKQISDTDTAVRALYKNHQVRGNWALGRVRAIGAPEPAKKLIFEDKMLTQRPELWSYPAQTSKCPQWGINPDKRGWWMGGSKLATCEMARTMQMFQGQIVIDVDVSKTSKCSSHLIVISPNKQIEYNKNGMKNSFVFGWDCNTKFITGPSKPKNEETGVVPTPMKATTKCAQNTHYKVEIKIENGAVLFSDDRCETISIPLGPESDRPYYVHMGASNPEAESRSTFSTMKIYQQVDVLGNGFGNIFELSMIKDDFTTKNKIDNTQWKPPIITPNKNTTVATAEYGFDTTLGVKQGQWFTGAFGGSTPIRSLKPFPFPFAVRGQLIKDAKCSNHFVVITTDPEEKWSWGEETDAIKIGWNCDTKFIYSTDPSTSVQVPCNKKGTFDIDIKIFNGMISFTDDVCGTLSTLNTIGTVNPDAELYVYYGADVDAGTVTKSTWKSLEVTGPERPPVVKDRRILMQDDFDFRKDLYQPMWSMDDTTGVSDIMCGSVSGNALHFGNSGARTAVTKPVDASKGARLEFAIRFGGSSIQCGKFINENDGVEVQYSIDDGASWKKLVRYTSKNFPEFSKHFTTVNNVVVDDQSFSNALTHTTLFRWTSINEDNRPCCGHWALDDVRIVSLETQGDLVVDEVFKIQNETAWEYPLNPASSNTENCRYTLNKRMLEFHGQCKMNAPTIKSKRPLNGNAGVVIETELKKDWKCANHVIAISNQPTVLLQPGPQNFVVKIGWNCNRKYIQTPTSIVQTSCENDGVYKTLIRIENNMITFEDNSCESLKINVPSTMSDGLFHVFMGSMQDISRGAMSATTKYHSIKIEQSVPSPYDSFTSPIIVDDFSEMKIKNWIYPNKTQGGDINGCTFRLDEQNGEARFGGNCTKQNPMRLKKSLPLPFNILAEIEKTDKCSNHYILLSPRKNEKFQFEPIAGIVSMGWNCDQKYLNSIEWKVENAKKLVNVTTKPDVRANPPTVETSICPNTGSNKLEIKVSSGVISFRDSNCNVLVTKNPYPVGTELYIYVGAAPSEPGSTSSRYIESSFTMVSVEGPASPPKLEDGVVMYDGFDYRAEMYPPMWTMGETTGRADQECGSKSGNSLRFFNPGVRVATTRSVDIRNGADLKFYIHMGGSDGPSCKKMSINYEKDGQNLQDGIRVQYTHDILSDANDEDERKQKGIGLVVEGGDTDDILTKSATRHTKSNLTDPNTGVVWHDLVDYDVLKYGESMGNGWTKIIIPIDYDDNHEAIGRGVRIRWIQHNQDAQACCDHWALDEVEIKAHEKPTRQEGLSADFLVRDPFTMSKYGANPIYWNMFETTGRMGTVPENLPTCDVRPPKETKDRRKVLHFDSDGPRIATTKPFNPKEGDGASVSFFLTFATAGADVLRTNTSNVVPVALEYSTDGGQGWNTLQEYHADQYPDAMDGCVRMRAEVDSKNNTDAYQESVQFRWSQAAALAPTNSLTEGSSVPQLRLSWSLDDVQIRTGALRIGFEDYELKQMDQHKWCYQPEATIAPYNYSYAENGKGHLSFRGNANGMGTVRTHMSFSAPVVIEADIVRNDECSNHYVAISPKKYFVWSWSPDQESIKMAYHCNEKMIMYGPPGSSDAVYGTDAQCIATGQYKIQITIKKNKVTFTDNQCQAVSIEVDPSVLRNFYIYVGAAQPVTAYDMEKLEVLPHMSAKNRGAKCDRIECTSNAEQPVCGSDGITYPSYCYLSIATCRTNIQKVSVGECPLMKKMLPSVFKDITITGRGSFAERKDNGDKACPVKQDCEVSEFSEWSNCSTACGEGVVTRNRTILTTPLNTGKKCPPLSETKVCNLRKCDCGVGEWSEYGDCDVPCGGGKSYRMRDIFRQPMSEGLQCPALNESRTCNSKPCARVGLPVVPARVKKMLHEQKSELFTAIDRTSGGWCYQDAEEIAPYSYGYVGNMGGVWFSGDGTNRSSMRTHKSFGTDNHDLFIEAEISKNSECSNHFVVLSPDPYYRWSWGSEPKTYKMVWNCDKKTLIHPNGKKETECKELKNYKLGIKVTKRHVRFEDDTCDELVAQMSAQDTSHDLYLYIGANYAEKNTTNSTAEGGDGSTTVFLERADLRRARLRHGRSTTALRRSLEQSTANKIKTQHCGTTDIPWPEVSCDVKTGAVVVKGGNARKCLTVDSMLLKGQDGRDYFDGGDLPAKVIECEKNVACVGIQKILHAARSPGRYSLRSGYDMQVAPNTGTNRNSMFCPKVTAKEIIKVTERDIQVSEGTVENDADNNEDEEDEYTDDRRPTPGWMKATEQSLGKLPVADDSMKYEYRFKKGNAWYISPPTSRVWDWEMFNTIPGTWKYGDSDGNNGDFECVGAADTALQNACGLGCTTGSGKKFKVLTSCKGAVGEYDGDTGTATVCQNRPNAFEGKACHKEVQISYYAILPKQKSGAQKMEAEERQRLKEQKEEEDIMLDGESDVADAALQAAETPPENAEDQIEGEPNRAVFKMLRVSGLDSVLNRFSGGDMCPHLVDCEVGGWGDWSNCSLPCDGGNTTRNRVVLAEPEYGGVQCPVLFESKICNTRECDCGVNQFNDWSECSRECGTGWSSRSRSIFRTPLGDGAACPELNQTKNCNEQACAVLGLPSMGPTDVVLKDAKRFDFTTMNNYYVEQAAAREEFCLQDPETVFPYEYNFTKNIGVHFKGNGNGRSTMRSKKTYRLPLRLDATFMREERCSNHYIVLSTDEYFMWSGATQEPGTIKFFYDCDTRRILAPPRSSSTTQKGGYYATKCQRHLRPEMEASIELSFAKSTLTDTTCGSTDISWMDILGNFAGKDLYLYVGAARKKVPWVDKGQSTFTSLRISGNGSLVNTINGSAACPQRQDCRVTPWTEFSECTAPCNGGNHSRTRVVVQEPKNKGKPCPELMQKTQCNTQHCGVDCVVTDFSEWSNCSKVCGGGIMRRTREIFQDLLNGTLYGKEQCPNLVEEKKCNDQICGVDCVVSDFTPWTACSTPCGGGGRKRYRNVLVKPVTGSHHGKQCPHLEESEPCNQQRCPPHEGPKAIYESKCSAMKGQCNACTNDPDCGYCPTTGECFLGNPEGPLPRFDGDISFLTDPQKYFMYLTNCSSYQFSYCAQSPCEQYPSCSQCLADSFCGWCAGSNKCAEGDAAGSFQEFCPRGWVHSPMHSGVGVRHRSDLLLTSRQVAAERERLGDFCEANTQEQRRAIQEQMEDEKTRNARLLRLQQSCAPCTGVWPNCQCEPDAFPLQLRPLAEEQVARGANEEAEGRQDAPKKELKDNGAACVLDDKCSSGTCVDRCCREEVNGCSGHGECDEIGGCLCEEGYDGNDCSNKNGTKVVVEEEDDGSKLAEEKKKLAEAEAKQQEEMVKSQQREETKKAKSMKLEEEAKKQAESLEEAQKSASKLEEAMKAGDPEAGTKYAQKQEEVEKQKMKEEEAKKAAEEVKKQSSEELAKQQQMKPEIVGGQEVPKPAPVENMTTTEQGEMKVQELMQNLTKPGANVPKIAQSIITVSYNNSANVASEEAQTLEKQSNNKYEDIVEQKQALEKTIAQEETVKGSIKQKEIESKENALAADKVDKAEKLVIENAQRAKVVQHAQEKKAVSDEKAAKAKAEMAKLQMQRETQAAHAEQNAADANILNEEMAKETLEQEAEKKRATAEALAKEQEVTSLKTLHTETDLAKEAAKKEELQKEIADTDATTGTLNEAGTQLAKDKAVRQNVVDTADTAVTGR